MLRLARFLLVLVIALMLLAGPCYGRTGFIDSDRPIPKTYVARGRSHHQRISKYDYGQGVSFHATVVENTLDDDYSVIPRSNNLHDGGRFARGRNYRR